MAKFLVVDDEPATVSALSQLLEDDGHHVAGFTSGQHALEALSKDHFEAVLTDLDMPHVNGEHVVRVARQHHPHACVFVSTGKFVRGLPVDACHIFSKPLDYDTLVRAVAACRANGGPGHHGRCHMKKPAREP